MDLHWHNKPTEPFFAQGKDTTRPNFSREERSQVAILVREALQNPSDIPVDDLSGPIRVVFRHLKAGEFDDGYLDAIFTSEFRERLKAASDVDLPPVEEAEVLVIEDFGTKGLIGEVSDFDADGSDQNWNAFWHREGEGAKGPASNGGAGQGKVTYYAHSLASAVLGLTHRSTDSEVLLMGRASFMRDYRFSDRRKYYRAAYWTTSDEGPTPESDADELQRFINAFRLCRGPTDSGLSLVIPFSKPFDHTEAVTSVILDFYMPIARGRLEVTVGNTKISAKTIDGIADNFISDTEVKAGGSSFTQAYRSFAKRIVSDPTTQVTLEHGWNKDRVIPESAFPEGTLDKLRKSLEEGEPISLSLPLKIKRKSGIHFDTEFNVYIEAPPELDRNEEAFIRRDLLIGAESHVTAGAFVQKTRSLIWIRDKDLSDFLLTAEEPTHLVWNASRARDRGEYVAPDIALRSIRQAVPRLLSILLGGNPKKDYKSLARFFSKPTSASTKKPGDSGQSREKDDTTTPPPPPPPPTPKPFRLDAVGTALRLSPTNAPTLADPQLPLSVTLELAYEGLDQDPFEAYDPYDFDVAHTSLFPIVATGVTVESRQGNCIELAILDSRFNFEISGFDPNIRTRARITYELPDESEDVSEVDHSESPLSGLGGVNVNV